MLLAQYLAVNGLTLREFARRCCTSASTMLRVRDGIVLPSRRVLLAIHRETEGAVSIAEMINLAMSNAGGSSAGSNSIAAVHPAERETYQSREGGQPDRVVHND